MINRSVKPLRINPICQSGITLIELMIGLLIGLVIIGAVLFVFLGSRVTYQYNDAMGRIQESGRIAIDMMSEDLRMTNFIGCRRLGTYLRANQTRFSPAFNSASGVLQGGISSNTVASPPAAPNTDSFTVLIGTAEIPLIDATSTTLTTANSVPPGPAIISDCQFENLNNDPFTTTPKLATGIVISATTTTLAQPIPGEIIYSSDATITPIIPTTYSIRPVAGRNDNSGNPVLSLFRNDDELIEGARNLCVRYGSATTEFNNDVGRYDAGTAVVNWNRVVAARIELLLASVDDGTLDSPQGNMPFCGGTFTPPDRRMYKVFTTTVGLRNQILSDSD